MNYEQATFSPAFVINMVAHKPNFLYTLIMNHTLIRYFLEAAGQSSFSRAAAAVGVPRQTISRQISHLENELGVTLFRRDTAQVVLTPQGEIYHQTFRVLARELSELRERTSGFALPQVTIRIGCLMDENVRDEFHQAAELLKSHHAGVRFIWERREPLDMMALLRAGKLDIGFCFERMAGYSAIESEAWNELLLCEAELMLITHRMNPLVRYNACATDFVNEPVYIWRSAMESEEAVLSRFMAVSKEQGLFFTNVSVLPNIESVNTMVEMGSGVTIRTDSSLLARNPNLIGYPTGKKRGITCLWHPNNHRAIVQELLAALLEVCEKRKPCADE